MSTRSVAPLYHDESFFVFVYLRRLMVFNLGANWGPAFEALYLGVAR